jgi:hypothetical protein
MGRFLDAGGAEEESGNYLPIGPLIWTTAAPGCSCPSLSVRSAIMQERSVEQMSSPGTGLWRPVREYQFGTVLVWHYVVKFCSEVSGQSGQRRMWNCPQVTNPQSMIVMMEEKKNSVDNESNGEPKSRFRNSLRSRRHHKPPTLLTSFL